MTFGDLFAGIGGMSLGLERAGMVCRWQVEIDEFCRKVLAKHWPNVARYGDIRECGANLEPVDLIAGGFPCQPVSQAGKRLAQADERWLWPEFARVVRHLRPRYVLVENVPGLRFRGLGDVLGTLATLGYDTEWQSIPAAAVGALHLRERVWLVAHARLLGQAEHEQLPAGPEQLGATLADPTGERCGIGRQGSEQPGRGEAIGCGATVANADHGHDSRVCEGREEAQGSQFGWAPSGPSRKRAVAASPHVSHADGEGELQPQRSERIFGGRLGNCGWWDVEPDVGRVAHGVPQRVDRLHALGNAVVPQVVEWIGRRIMEAQP